MGLLTMTTPPYKDLPADQLVTVQGSIQLEKNTAAAWLEFKAAAKAEADIIITIAAPLGGYRSHAQDVDFHKNPAKYNKNPNIGLLPIDYSVHRTGRCVDVVPWPTWVKNNAHRWGFSFPIAIDVNHMQHDGSTVADTGAAPLSEEDDVIQSILIRNAGDGGSTGHDGPGAGQVVLSDTLLTKWVGLSAGYPELLQSIGLIAQADGTVAPNMNVPSNVFGYLQSIAGNHTPPIDVGSLASTLAKLLPAGSTDITPILTELGKISAQVTALPAPPKTFVAQ